jgi:HD-like signal output (HDOD) protein
MCTGEADVSVTAQDEKDGRQPALASIPVFPPIALRVLDLASQNDIAMRQLSEVIGSDAVFSAQVLRLANSPMFGHGAQIESLSHALVTLGLERLQGLAMTVATSNYLRTALRIEELRRCWRHTLACAILCRELARAASISEELGYMLGLLHDIGRLGLLVAHPNEYAEMLRDADREPMGLLDLEKKRFGMDHCEVGRRLAEQWNLPEDFPFILGRHHDPPSGTSLDILGVVYHGCRLADALGFSVLKPLRSATLEEIHAALPAQIAERFSATAGDLAKMVEERIQLHDSGDPAALSRSLRGGDSEPGPESAQETEFDEEAAGSLLASLQASPLAWDSLVVATTAGVILAVLGAFWYLFRV